MALGMMGRLVKLGTGLHSAAKGAGSFAEKALTSNVAKKLYQIPGKTFDIGWKAASNVGNWGFKAGLKIKGADWNKIGTTIGTQVGKAGQAIGTDLKGLNNMAGALTGGVKVQPLNNGLNKLFKTNKFKDMRLGQLIKDDPDAVLFGKKFTRLGTMGVVGISGMVAAKDAMQNRVRAQAGVNTGLASNAPVNTYSQDQTFPTMGASYANNAGATGDLALSLHRQRHSGIL